MKAIAWHDEDSDTIHLGTEVDGQRVSLANVPGEQARANAANLNAAQAEAEAASGSAK